ncbi:hypothetical protein LCGC14_0486970 [marine sediment metagenome]|uniref:Uncharacterized protein n=1 Tax=marine sediment metagenome TaxID=412755 RepID=A0A0F9VGF6_9ZZZZ
MERYRDLKEYSKRRKIKINVRDLQIKLLDRTQIRFFIETWHYSKSINGVIADYCFGLFNDSEMIGAMLYGRMAMAGQWKKYGEKAEDIIELRRLCCIDETPKNTESRFIGLTLRWLKNNTEIKTVISYADPNFGHKGIIYRASNFKHVGMSAPGRVIIYGGKRYHDKTIRTKYKGELKPFALKIKKALDSGGAYYVKQKGKFIYRYDLVLNTKGNNNAKRTTSPQ